MAAPMSDAPSLLHLSVLLNGERVLQLPPLGGAVDVATIKMMIEAETNISSGSLVLLHKQRVLTDAQTLGGVGVATNEMLEARTGGVMAPAAGARPAASAPGAQGQQQQRRPQHPLGPSTNRLGIPDSILHDPSKARDFLRSTPALLFQIESQNPSLYRAIMAQDIAPFAQAWKHITDNMAAEQAAEVERIRLASADPMDPSVQAKIEEEIRLKNVQENWESAMEYNPEVFGRVLMLYVPMSVNGVKLQAFVDSGAQSTIMSVQCAERTGIMRLIDKRYAGVAKGVGSAKILGRVHQVPCVIGTKHVAMSFTILENQGMEFLLGLDQLKNHQACIDLAKNVLRIQGEEIPFLAEKDLPRENKEGLGQHQEEWEDGSGAASSSSSAASAAGSSARPAAAASAASGSSSAIRPAPAAGSNPSVSPPSANPSAANAAAVAAAQNRAAATAAHSAAHSASAAAAAAAQPARPAAASPPAAAAPAAAAVSAAAPRPSPAAAAAGAAPFPESVIEQLVGLGFTRAESIQALQMCGGNAELAAGHLFNM